MASVKKGQRGTLLRAPIAVAIGAVTLFALGAAQPAAAGNGSIGAPPSCAGEPHKYWPEDTGPHHKIFDWYYFTVQHGGSSADFCSLFPNVHPGDTVAAHFQLTDWAASQSISTEVTLVSYTRTSKTALQQQFDCNWFSNDDHDSWGDPCRHSKGYIKHPSNPQTLTVTIPSCAFQVAFIYREAAERHDQSVKAPQQYGRHGRWITAMAGGLHDCSSSTTDRASGGAAGGSASSRAAAFRRLHAGTHPAIHTWLKQLSGLRRIG
jgi:hypothetical protein